MEEITAYEPYALKVYIEHPDRPYDSNFSIPLPTNPEVAQVFLDNFRINDIHNIKIGTVFAIHDDDNDLSYWLKAALKATDAKHSLEELNYLVTKIADMNEDEREIFAAAMQSGVCADTIGDMINLTENLDKFDLAPAYNAEFYGEFLVDMHRGNCAAGIEKLENSANEYDRELAQYIERLEKCVDSAAYGKMIAKEENGKFTDYGYLRRYEEFENFRAAYRGIEDIPHERRLTPSTKTPGIKVDCLNGQLAVGDLVLSAPFLATREIHSYSSHESEEVYSSMVGVVTEIKQCAESGKESTNHAVVDFTKAEYSQNRLVELDRQLGNYYGRETSPGEWPPIDVDSARMSADGLLRITEFGKDSPIVKAILDREEAAISFYNTAKALVTEKKEAAQKPSLDDTLNVGKQKSREQFGEPTKSNHKGDLER